jgi:hypothetical protein
MNSSTLMSRRIQRGFRVIASVYPARPEAISRPFDGWTTYTLPAVPKGDEPHLLQIRDAVQFEVDPLVRDVIKENLIFAEQVCEDLVGHWARTPIGAPPGTGPGIGLIAGPMPTDEEIQALYTRQDLMFEWLYQEGLRLAQNQEWRGIDQRHRLAAAWLNREEPWAIDSGRIMPEVEECPACGSEIPAGKAICRVCRTQIRELPTNLAHLQPGSVPERERRSRKAE